MIQDNTGAIERLRVHEATGNLSRNGALFVHTTGTDNTFVGAGAGSLATIGTGRNTALGSTALSANTTGSRNSAFGRNALGLNSTAIANSAFGAYALGDNSTGILNSAVGERSLFHNTTGFHNSAVGVYALRDNTSGNNNIGVGFGAGLFQTTGSNNIYIGNQGAITESGQIKIGSLFTHTQATIVGIHGNTSAGGIAVLVNASGVLGTTTSSARFKHDVRDMGKASDVLRRLRPVTFRYREEAAEGGDIQYGLIAEEVAQVAPELVAPDLEGRPYSVRYHVLPALLLNELQEQERTIEAQHRVIAALASRLEAVEQRLPGAAQEPSR